MSLGAQAKVTIHAQCSIDGELLYTIRQNTQFGGDGKIHLTDHQDDALSTELIPDETF